MGLMGLMGIVYCYVMDSIGGMEKCTKTHYKNEFSNGFTGKC